jgi:hypothetical protein
MVRRFASTVYVADAVRRRPKLDLLQYPYSEQSPCCCEADRSQGIASTMFTVAGYPEDLYSGVFIGENAP